MVTGPKKQPVVLTSRQQEVLEQLLRRRLTPQQIAKRARLLLLSAQGYSDAAISRLLPLDRPQVGIWRKRWITHADAFAQTEAQQPHRLEEAITSLLQDAPRPGAPAKFTSEQIVRIVAVACEPPSESKRPISHWTPREIREEVMERGIVPDISVRQIGRFLK